MQNLANTPLGNMLKTELLQIGPTKYAVQLRWVYSSTGGTVEHLVIFAEAENVFEVILDIGSRAENGLWPNKLDYGWNTDLYFQKPDEDSSYYNLIVTYYGDVKDMPYTEFYAFSNGKYNLVPKKSN